MRYRYKGRRYRIRLFPILIVVLLIIALMVFGVTSCTKQEEAPVAQSSQEGSSVSSTIEAISSDNGILVGGEPASSEVSSQSGSSSGGTDSSGAAPAELPEGTPADWNLILLNPEDANKIDGDLDIEKIKFDNQYVDARAAPSYQKMADAAKAEGITLFLRSGYRSMATQKTNYEANVKREIAKGNNEAEAIRLTNLYYTTPGHSEHHSGLAFDIITPEYHNDVYDLNEKFADTDAYQWLIKNCAEYGFILRYPKEKYGITHINFEPWHYRYVGVEHAKYIMKHSICLEEYMELLKAAGR